MSNVRRGLTDRTKEVQSLYLDLRDCQTTGRQDWDATVPAPQTLGEKTEVEKWFLAARFLIAWHDWRGFWCRAERYFGKDDSSRHARSLRLNDHGFLELAEWLLAADGLCERVTSDWARSGELWGAPDDSPSVRHYTHTIIQNHQRWALTRDLVSHQLTLLTDLPRQRHPQAEGWTACAQHVRRLNDAAVSTCSRLAEEQRADLLSRLRAYRCSHLLVSWLLEGDLQDDTSALLQLSLENIEAPAASFEAFLHELQPAELSDPAHQVLDRVTAAVWELGYATFYEDLTGPYFRGFGTESLLASELACVLGGREEEGEPDPCPLILAPAKAGKRRRGLRYALPRLQVHLGTNPGIRAAVVVTDERAEWVIDQHLEGLRTQYTRGVRYLFLQVDEAGRLVSPIHVRL